MSVWAENGQLLYCSLIGTVLKREQRGEIFPIVRALGSASGLPFFGKKNGPK